ncbi:succinate dehydrogenase subunit 3-2, mitochondrial-like [Dendrobium catenatum]|uniref:Succinate dehydrogenase cytochrome b560 subunit n=1 Tax=Dendrobium catenatum TaxID=906689 RepID=A0A2I0X3R8_9ASPA|nr:succinate dehydrogenase subunit 3-2, mitochondrial-like [Dendrobium catenatum]XP_020692145.1 succinate dehydrogenase subunit 3-2, mitochondrial-like [Dendrobium catenatum]PKU82552.1 Succinate dehydrogenase cytochrome b560 subunit [Dendrobium catenatum]
MDTSFALRGIVNSTRSNGKNVLRQLPSNIELPTEDNSVKRFLTGTRAFHESRVVSESAKGAYFNRPLSPHLPLKKPQLSATYSISHRIFGVGVASAILLFPLAMKFSALFDV